MTRPLARTLRALEYFKPLQRGAPVFTSDLPHVIRVAFRSLLKVVRARPLFATRAASTTPVDALRAAWRQARV